ncbi:post-transcriptional regulator [Bacillus sp. CMF12]|uniref:post-transcriptional regulator n=1 Tax=Bacillaceae TaxID=186817 RepID=UPI001FB3C023|nr:MULTISPECIES: post-transcriptional regulator [Bacillaceae]MDF2038754.1 post-transcriptional regulator [Cytobacillus oceanisediminis]UOE54538.1 post-transcriptional regulator [Cytobacillus oceanisediminis]USK49047.1 post-transcriptional regulator [Bacillus sp. CMF12]
MKIGHEYDYFRITVKPALESKLDEFRLLGYKKVTEQELWGFLTKKKWKKPKENVRLFEIVEEVMEVKVSEYIHYATIEAFKEADFAFENEEERRELLK